MVNTPSEVSRSSAGNGSGVRSRSRGLRDFVVIGWLLALFAVIFVHRWVPDASWLMIHLVLLGALTHSAMVWSEYFAEKFLHERGQWPADGEGEQSARPPHKDAQVLRGDTAQQKGIAQLRDKEQQDRRILLLAAGTLGVLVGFPAGWWWLVVDGAVLVATAIVWHGVHLYRRLRRAAPRRFRVVVHYYLAASAALPIGVLFGVLMARHPAQPWYGRLHLAHVSINILGWIGLTVVGTLVVLWPAMVRARMDERAESLAQRALPVLGLGMTVAATGALLGFTWLSATGVLVYLCGTIVWGLALVAPVKARGIREFAPASVAAGLFWAAVALVWLAVDLFRAQSWADITAALPIIGGVLAAGFGIQVLFGALTYLVPMVLGGGASVVQAAQSSLHKWTTFRIIVPNATLALWLLPTPSWVRVTMSALGVLALATFVPLLVVATKRAVAALRARRTGEKFQAPSVPRAWNGKGLVAAVSAVLLAGAAGVAVDPGAVGLSSGPHNSGGAVATGQQTRVKVTVDGMHFSPSVIDVPKGNSLVVEFTNTGTDVHNLVIGNARTQRLSPGHSETLEVGVITDNLEGYCSIAGHRQMGMTLNVIATPGAEATGGGAEGHGAHGAHGSDSTGNHGAGGQAASGKITNVPGAQLAHHIDPALPRLGAERVHKHRFEVTEVPSEIAPGLWQTRWTFNGQSVGPTLHGRVGDVFEITLVNNGSMGHSIDFHAGELAPDRPMRTIAPGEQLVYRFTATRAGIWMYHCGTMPMTSHIAAGMHGAVIIEPDGLPQVDHEFALTQSEIYLANEAHSANEAREVDGQKIADERPDRVVFNGIANQYDQFPFEVKAGQRVRFWVLNAGPNRALSFHIVGGQFDTAWTEGHYTLNRGVSADGASDGGAQVLPLLPAQGGFVELTFPEPGHFAVVNHAMIDAERGAHGIVHVS